MPAHEDGGGVLVVDQAELVGGAAEVHGQRAGAAVDFQPEQFRDAVAVQFGAAVEAGEVARHPLQCEWVVVAGRIQPVPDQRAGLSGLSQQSGRRGLGRHEDMNLASVQSALAVAASGGLRDRIQPGQRSVDHREIQVDAGLHELGRDHPHGCRRLAAGQGLSAGGQGGLDVGDDFAAVLRAHQRREVPQAGPAGGQLAGEALVEFAGIGTAADDGQHRVVAGEGLGGDFPGLRLRQLGRQAHPHALQGVVQGGFVVDDGGDLTGCVAAQPAPAEVALLGERRLGGGAEHDGGAVVAHQQAQHVHHRLQEVHRQQLRLVDDDDAAAQGVQLAAARSLAGEQALEELHAGGHHHGRVPVLAGQAGTGGFGCLTQLGGVAVVLQHDALGHVRAQRREDLAVDLGGLLDDAGVGNHHHHPAQAVLLRMGERKGEAGQRLAAAGGHGQGVGAGGTGGLGAAGGEHLGAAAVDGARGQPGGLDCCGLVRHVGVERGEQVGHRRRRSLAQRCGARVHEGFGVEEVRVHQGREEHAHPQGEAAGDIFVAGTGGEWQRLRVGQHECRREDLRVRCRGQGLPVFAQRVVVAQPAGQVARLAVPVIEPGMVTGNDVLQQAGADQTDRALSLLQPGLGMQRAGARMALVAALRQPAFDVRLGHLPDVALKAGAVLAQVVPQAGQVGQGGQRGVIAAGPDGLCRQPGNRLQVFAQPVRRTAVRGAVCDRLVLHLWCLPEVDFSPVETR